MGSKMLEGYYAEGLAALDRGFDARERTSRVPQGLLAGASLRLADSRDGCLYMTWAA